MCVVSASRRNSSVRCVYDSAALGGPKCEHLLLVPVCFGSRPSTFCSAPSRPVHHRVEERTRWDLEHNCANISIIQAIKHLLYGPVILQTLNISSFNYRSKCKLTLKLTIFRDPSVCVLVDGFSNACVCVGKVCVWTYSLCRVWMSHRSSNSFFPRSNSPI